MAGKVEGFRPPLDPSKMPRPPHRTIPRSLRFTPEEWEAVSAKIAGRDFSAVTRALLLDTELPQPQVAPKKEVIRKRMTEAEAAKIRHLSWIGNNLNQIARRANEGAVSISLLEAIISLEREIRRVADAR